MWSARQKWRGTSPNESGSSKRWRNGSDCSNLSNDAILVRDGADRVTYWNKSACELYGYPSEEAMGRVAHELLSHRVSRAAGEALSNNYAGRSLGRRTRSQT